LLAWQVADPRELLRTLRKLHYEDNLLLEAVIPLFTSRPAVRLQLPNKGSVSATSPPCATSFQLYPSKTMPTSTERSTGSCS
jgi:hypothetical protein